MQVPWYASPTSVCTGSPITPWAEWAGIGIGSLVAEDEQEELVRARAAATPRKLEEDLVAAASPARPPSVTRLMVGRAEDTPMTAKLRTLCRSVMGYQAEDGKVAKKGKAKHKAAENGSHKHKQAEKGEDKCKAAEKGSDKYMCMQAEKGEGKHKAAKCNRRVRDRDWQCTMGSCKEWNFRRNQQCRQCDAWRPVAESKKGLAEFSGKGRGVEPQSKYEDKFSSQPAGKGKDMGFRSKVGKGKGLYSEGKGQFKGKGKGKSLRKDKDKHGAVKSATLGSRIGQQWSTSSVKYPQAPWRKQQQLRQQQLQQQQHQLMKRQLM